MIWLQNLIIITISFLLSRVLIDSNAHTVVINYLLNRSGKKISSVINGILYISFFLSIFFSNTVVALSMIPVIKESSAVIPNKEHRDIYTTYLVLALIYGANIGGMGSLIGSALNIIYLGFVEFNDMAGREYINFFSWLAVGLPTSFILAFISRYILKLSEKKDLEFINPQPLKVKSDIQQVNKYIFFYVANLLFISLLSALQFIMAPAKIWMRFNIIDLIFLFYLILFLFIVFILPKNKQTSFAYQRNIGHFLMFLLFTPFVFITETLKEISARITGKRWRWLLTVEERFQQWFNHIWYILFSEKKRFSKLKNKESYVSMNRILYDLPYFGLILMGAIILVVYLATRIGGDAFSLDVDGYLSKTIEGMSFNFHNAGAQLFVLFIILTLLTIFMTEIVNNMSAILILFPITLEICSVMNFNPLILLLAITVSASGAFMTPIATSVNALSFGALEGVSIKMMIRKGILLNIVAALYLSVMFFIIHFLFI
jgi:sodium-dependent dicarboxylate transporter 2/3/5